MNIVGALLYVAVMTRPDISYNTSMLAKFMSDPTPEAYDLAVNLLLYLAHNPSLKMTYNGQASVPHALGKNGKNPFLKHSDHIISNGGFVAYSDSSWGNKYPYPMFGFVIYLFGGIVSFASKQLKIIAFSSCEAEYAACAYTCKEIQFIRSLCRDLGFELKGALVLGVDNTAAIEVANNNGVTARTKHFGMCIHYFRDLVQNNSIIAEHILTAF